MVMYLGLGYQGPTSNSGLIFVSQSTQVRGYNEVEREFGRGLLGAILRLISSEVKFSSE
jgi:hypothetical protein